MCRLAESRGDLGLTSLPGVRGLSCVLSMVCKNMSYSVHFLVVEGGAFYSMWLQLEIFLLSYSLGESLWSFKLFIYYFYINQWIFDSFSPRFCSYQAVLTSGVSSHLLQNTCSFSLSIPQCDTSCWRKGLSSKRFHAFLFACLFFLFFFLQNIFWNKFINAMITI